MKFGVGQSVGRVEDRRFITGSGCYTDDVDPWRTLWVAAHLLKIAFTRKPLMPLKPHL